MNGKSEFGRQGSRDIISLRASITQLSITPSHGIPCFHERGSDFCYSKITLALV